MCGFVGFIVDKSANLKNSEVIIKNMSDTIIERGPDDCGFWSDRNKGISLGFRRLAIQDLTSAGYQPMKSTNGELILCFNGEIYNHYEIRSRLESEYSNISWNGHSDTETILRALEFWGLKDTLKALSGMFALAIWDTKKERLTLARDRYGEKPLYYGWVNRSFLFGSQLKAFKEFPAFSNQLSTHAITQYFRFNYVPAPLSIYQDIFKLEPGCFIELDKKNISDKTLNVQQYWSLSEIITQAKNNLITDETKALKTLSAQLKSTIKDQMISDVPLGAFLSGGIDSSLIVSMMQEQSKTPIKTFTIGFDDKTYDESIYAKSVANHLGTDHSELILSTKDAQNVIKKLPDLYDEPFADSSQIPTYLVSRLAKTKVTVILSGDAGDELFGGYNRYFWAPRIWKNVSWMPYFLRKFVSKIVFLISVDHWNRFGKLASLATFNIFSISRLGDKAHKFADRLKEVNSIDDLYKSLVTQWDDPSFLIKNGDSSFSNIDFKIGALNGDRIHSSELNEMEKMMYFDSISYLPDDILCKVDRATMGVSLEARVPFLDPKIAEIAWRIPNALKLKDGKSKAMLRKILEQYIPKELIERPKSGFGVPIGDWLRGDLQEWAEGLLSKDRIEEDGILNFSSIEKIWNEHLSYKRDWTHKLWSILMFQQWLRDSK